MNRRWMLLLCVSVPSFMINLDANIVAVSLASIARSLHADFGAIEWVISSYTLAFASLVMPAGALADRFGRKRMLVLGLLIFTVASFFCGAASSTESLNIARAVQGIGAALQLSAALAVLSHGFHGRERAKAFAFWGSVIGVAIMLGPVAGGLLTQMLGWQWAFYVNLPVGVVMIALVLIAVVDSRDPAAGRIDIGGVVLFSGALASLTWALISGSREGWSSPAIVGCIATAAVLFLAFLAVEMRQARPMMELAYFGKRTYLGANIAAVTFAVSFLTMLTYLPLFFRSALGYSPLDAGLLMLPLALPLFAVPRLVSRHLEYRVSGRALLALGLVLVACGLAASAVAISAMTYGAVAGPMFVAAVGAGILNGQVAKVGMTVIPVERAGMASGVSGTMRFSGVVVGFAALGAILLNRIAADIHRIWPAAGPDERGVIARLIANGDLSGATTFLQAHGAHPEGILGSLANGYAALMATAAALAFIAAATCWWLIDPEETAPKETALTEEIQVLTD